MNFNAAKTFSEWYTPIDTDKAIAHMVTLKGVALIDFVRTCCLADPIFLMTYLYTRPFTWFHKEWVDETLKNLMVNKKRMFLVLGPRGFAKSTAVITGICLWMLIHEEAKYHTIGVISTSKDKAQGFMGYIRQALEHPKIIALFGNLKGDVWKTDHIDLKGKGSNVRGANLRAFGRGGGLVGQHFTMALFVDDLVDGDMVSEHYRDKLINWWDSSVQHCIEPGAIVPMCGTRWHPKDFYQTIIDRGAMINTTRSCWLNKQDLIPLWPEKGFTKEMLLELQKDNPITFQMQMENEISLYEGQIFKREWFREIGNQSYNGEVTLSVDIAFREKSRNDYSAIAAIRKTPDGLYVIENCIRGRWTGHELRDKIIKEYKRFAAKKVLLEDSFQNKAILGNRLFLTQDLRVAGVPVLTVKPVGDKTARYFNVQPLFECGQVVFRSGLNSAIQEMIAVPRSDFDDQADAITQGIIYMEGSGTTYTFA